MFGIDNNIVVSAINGLGITLSQINENISDLRSDINENLNSNSTSNDTSSLGRWILMGLIDTDGNKARRGVENIKELLDTTHYILSDIADNTDSYSKASTILKDSIRTSIELLNDVEISESSANTVNLISGAVSSFATMLNEIGKLSDEKDIAKAGIIIEAMSNSSKSLAIILPTLSLGIGSLALVTSMFSLPEITLAIGIASATILGLGSMIYGVSKIAGEDSSLSFADGVKSILLIGGSMVGIAYATRLSVGMYEDIGSNYDIGAVTQGGLITSVAVGAMAGLIALIGQMETSTIIKGGLTITAIGALLYGLSFVMKDYVDTMVYITDEKYKESIEDGSLTVLSILGSMSAIVGVLGGLASSGVGAIVAGAGFAVLAGIMTSLYSITNFAKDYVDTMVHFSNTASRYGGMEKFNELGLNLVKGINEFTQSFIFGKGDIAGVATIAFENRDKFKTLNDIMLGTTFESGILTTASTFLDVIDKLGNMKVIANIDRNGNITYKALSSDVRQLGTMGSYVGLGMGAFVKNLTDTLSTTIIDQDVEDKFHHTSKVLMGGFRGLFDFLTEGNSVGILTATMTFLDVIDKFGNLQILESIDSNGTKHYKPLSADLQSFARQASTIGTAMGNFVSILASSIDESIEDAIPVMEDVAKVMMGEGWSLSSSIFGKDAGFLPFVGNLIDLMMNFSTGKYIARDSDGKVVGEYDYDLNDMPNKGILVGNAVGGFITSIAKSLQSGMDIELLEEVMEDLQDIANNFIGDSWSATDVIMSHDYGILEMFEAFQETMSELDFNKLGNFNNYLMEFMKSLNKFSNDYYLHNEVAKRFGFNNSVHAFKDMEKSMSVLDDVFDEIENLVDGNRIDVIKTSNILLGELGLFISNVRTNLRFDKDAKNDLLNLNKDISEIFGTDRGFLDVFKNTDENAPLFKNLNTLAKSIQELARVDSRYFSDTSRLKSATIIKDLDEVIKASFGTRNKSLDVLIEQLKSLSKELQSVSKSTKELNSQGVLKLSTETKTGGHTVAESKEPSIVQIAPANLQALVSAINNIISSNSKRNVYVSFDDDSGYKKGVMYY